MMVLMALENRSDHTSSSSPGTEQPDSTVPPIHPDTTRRLRRDGWPPIQGGAGEPSQPPQTGEAEPRPETPFSLLEFSDRVAYVVTDLNGLISGIVNEEITASDFDTDPSELWAKLAEIERAVNELADLFWK
jgi:hypothetical protein